ncbi:conserved hypothetical protein [Desulforamulus reducens MI-1]|uniref:Cytoskeleton protein RodZ-like C-terminal domain-containing protein n=1 Tax=Desulforamulus reducens (strain ATCC BAA-1160 / DSM 100696 / MI-1) TaxID=349161 RepID=A4J5U9_DESRM|nr:conserved hypothetical protein [Desulforamulus reducens MI-1]
MAVGEALRSARKEKGYSFEYLEEATKIRAKYLEALENEEFDILPGPVYAKAFLRTYAKYLEINTEEIMEEYGQITQDNQPPVEEKKQADPEPVISGNKMWRYVAAGLAIVSLLAFNTFYNNSGQTKDNKPDLPKTAQDNLNSSAEKTPSQINVPTKPRTPQEMDGVRVVLKVTEKQSWMQVEADGNTVFSGLVGAGEMKDFKAQEKIFLHVGNAGVVEVNVNGKNLGRLGENGKVVRIPFNAGEDPKLTQG